VTGAVFDAMTL